MHSFLNKKDFHLISFSIHLNYFLYDPIYYYKSFYKIIFNIGKNYIFLIYISSLKAVINIQDQIILMVNKKHNFLGIVLSVTILSAIFFASISTSAFSQLNSTDSTNSTTVLPSAINATSTLNTNTNATAGPDVANSSSTGSK
jgi:hypothetical protein